MSTHVTAFVSPDDPTYQKHKKVMIACHEAGVSLPAETAKYFGHTYTDLSSLEEKLEIDIETHKWEDDMAEGYEVYVKDLPEGVHKIRFYNSY